MEIERKFLVKNTTYKQEAIKMTFISQGFLNTNPDRTVRVRSSTVATAYAVEDGYSEAFITIKGLTSADGTTRPEWEYPIPVEDACHMLRLCEEFVTKNRYDVPHGDVVFEVDEFVLDNLGLTVAEVELLTADQPFDKPVWLGKEVTGDPRFYNSSLSKHPFKDWSEEEREEFGLTS